MKRRSGLIVTLALAFLAGPLPAGAQPRGTVWRIGYLSPGPAADHSNPVSSISALRQGLRDLGYVEGQNLVIESRYAEGHDGRLSSLAADLVRLRVAVIVTWGPGIIAAKNTTTTIPIVMTTTLDAVVSGFVQSLARPGGNITGLTLISTELMGKRIELLAEALPRLARLAVLIDSSQISLPVHQFLLESIEAAAKAKGVRLQMLPVRDAIEFDSAFSAMARELAGALYVVENPLLTTHLNRIVELARKHRLPTMFGAPRFVELGGLMAYGPNTREMNRRAATYVDRILKGARPGDLPVEQPTKFELVINLQTAKALGLTIPRALLLRADQVIE